MALGLTRLLAQSYVLAPRRFAGDFIEADMIEIALVCDSCGSIIARGTTTASALRFEAGELYNRRECKDLCLQCHQISHPGHPPISDVPPYAPDFSLIDTATLQSPREAQLAAEAASWQNPPAKLHSRVAPASLNVPPRPSAGMVCRPSARSRSRRRAGPCAHARCASRRHTLVKLPRRFLHSLHRRNFSSRARVGACRL